MTNPEPPATAPTPPVLAPPVAPAPAAPPMPPPSAPALVGRPPEDAAADEATAASPGRARSHTANPAYGVVIAIGGIALIIGSFLNAASASLGSGSLAVSVDQSYMDVDGPVTLAVGIVVVVLGGLIIAKVVPWWVGWVAGVVGAVGALIAAADSSDVRDSVEQVKALGGTGSVGPALWICVLGGLVTIAGGVLTAMLRDDAVPA